MNDKDDEWWLSGKNKVVNSHIIDNDGNEWDEEYVEEYPSRYKPSYNVLKRYMDKNNRKLDTRSQSERQLGNSLEKTSVQKGWKIKH